MKYLGYSFTKVVFVRKSGVLYYPVEIFKK